METILLYNQCVPIVGFDQFRFNLEDGTCVNTFGRGSQLLEPPLTGKLLQFLKSCGINVPPTVTIGDSWMGPRINLGFDFDSYKGAPSSLKGYLHLDGLDREFNLDNDDTDLFENHNVSLRVDIETLTDDVSNCSLKPDVMSHVFQMHWGTYSDFGQSVTSASVTFRSADTSTVNNEDRFDVEKLLHNWMFFGSKWKLTMSLSLILTPKSETERPDPGVLDHLIPNKRMRMNPDQTFADFTIITGSGTQVKCHRAVLAAQSPYFARMLESGMKEARTGTVELSGMSAEGVGAMLDYFYTWNVAVLEKNPLVCVELLEAGHKYGIQPLEKCTKKIILAKPSDWYTPEAALQLIIYLKDMDMAELKQKAVQVCKKRLPEMKKLPAYDKLAKEKPEVLIQLFEYVLTV